MLSPLGGRVLDREIGPHGQARTRFRDPRNIYGAVCGVDLPLLPVTRRLASHLRPRSDMSLKLCIFKRPDPPGARISEEKTEKCTADTEEINILLAGRH